MSLLKDYLLDDLSSCSSNGFRSYPRRQRCIKVRYLIESDLNKPWPMHKQFRSKPKSKSSSVLHKASAAVVNVFKHFHFSGKPRKPNLNPKLSKRGFWKQRTIDEPVKGATVTVKTAISNSSSTEDSCFSATSDSSTTGGSSMSNVAQDVVEESDQLAVEKMNPVNGENAVVITATATLGNGNAKEKMKTEEKDHLSPISVMDFPCDEDEDEVTSPFNDRYFYVEGSKRKVMSKVQRTKTLKPVRLEDRITLSESKILDISLQSRLELEEDTTKKKAVALLQLFKATMPSPGLSESTITESVLLEFLTERVNEGNVSNYIILQDAKNWVNGQVKEMFDTDNYKLAYIRDMEKRVKWLTYDDEIEKAEVVSIIEYEVFTSLVEEMLLDYTYSFF